MSRELVYPNYKAELFDGGDIRLTFNVPNSKFGAIAIVLAADDADELAHQIDKAWLASNKMLAAETTA